MDELLFIIGFTIHNIEEALWLPDWSINAGVFHIKVSNKGFRFAVIIITAIGYFLTYLFLFTVDGTGIIRLIYLGFVMMMVVNVVLPHISATVLLKKYAPGTLTGVIFNLPFGSYILYFEIHNMADFLNIVLSCFILSLSMFLLIRLLFKISEKFG